jgi:hypothetical protein
MALTRKFLKALEIDDTKIDQIIEAHTESTDALKEARDSFKTEADKVADLQKQIDSITKERDAYKKQSEENDSYKEKYEAEKKAHDGYKQEVEAEKVRAKKTAAYKALLKKAGVADRYLDDVLKVTQVDDIELDDKGEIKQSEEAITGAKEKWSSFIETTSTKGVDTPTPPENKGANKMTKEEIMAIKDRNERQKAISENHELFGF